MNGRQQKERPNYKARRQPRSTSFVAGGWFEKGAGNCKRKERRDNDNSASSVIAGNHSALVYRLIKPGRLILQEMTALDAYFAHIAVGICGEAGELADALKRKAFYQIPLDRENVREEIGDIEFFLEALRQVTGFTREECLQANFDKLTARYGKSYSNAKAKARADKK